MALPDLLAPTIDDFVTRAGAMLDRAVEHAGEAMDSELRKLASQAERQLFSAAIREMSIQRAAWRVAFPGALRKAIKDPPAPKRTAMISPSSLSFTLVDDQEVEQSIEVSRLAQQLRSATDQSLAELDALMSSALGLEGIQPEENPLRPDVFAGALRSLVALDAQQPEWVGIWMRQLAPALGEDLSEAYRNSIKLLKRARVEAAGYRVITAPSPLGSSKPAPLEMRSQSRPTPLEPVRSSRPAELAGDTPSQTAALWRNVSGFAELVSQALRGPAFAEFLARGSAHAKQALAPAWFARVDSELAALEARSDEAPLSSQFAREYAHMPAVDRPMREVGTDKPLDGDVWGELSAPRRRSIARTQLKKQARNVGQAMGIEAVRQLVDQVARDRRLLAPVRESFVALENSLSRLALQSPQFFGEEQHPARRLVERVAERSFKYNDEFSQPFQSFFQDVTEHFKEIDAVSPLRDEQPFAQALEALEATWAEEDRAEEAEKQRVLEAMQFAEARQAEAAEVSWGLSQRTDLEGVPAVVQDFLYNRWALVMAHARLKSGGKEIDPGAYGSVVTDLLWTVKRDLVLRDPPHAFGLIPKVLGKLREGLELLGDTPAEDDKFFRALEKLHRPVLKLRAKHRKNAIDLPSDYAELAEAEGPAAPPGKSEEVFLAASEQRKFGYRDTEFHPRAAERERAVNPADMPAAETVVALLEVGAWVDLYSRQDWLRAQLTWASANKQLFLFTSHGGLAHTMTRRSLLRLVGDRMLRTVEGHAVVQHAIEQIARPERLVA